MTNTTRAPRTRRVEETREAEEREGFPAAIQVRVRREAEHGHAGHGRDGCL